jgi:hypothetical protein
MSGYQMEIAKRDASVRPRSASVSCERLSTTLGREKEEAMNDEVGTMN